MSGDVPFQAGRKAAHQRRSALASPLSRTHFSGPSTAPASSRRRRQKERPAGMHRAAWTSRPTSDCRACFWHFLQSPKSLRMRGLERLPKLGADW